MENELRKGEELFTEGRIDDAEDQFLSIVKRDNNSKEAYNNLGVIAFQKNDIKRAIEYFTRSLEIDYSYKDAVINYTDLLGSLNQSQIAIPLLEKIVEDNPRDNEMRRLLEEISPQKHPQAKMVVLCLPGLESFLDELVNFLGKQYEVKSCYSHDQHEIESAVQWADIVWLEWANELSINLTNHAALLERKHVICRLHSYEAFVPFAQQIRWEKVNDLLFVAEHIKHIVLQQVPDLPEKVKNIHIVPNGIDLNKFPLKERPRGKNLAFLGHINFKKGPMLLLHAFRELAQTDGEYRLCIAGEFQEIRYRLYFNQMIEEMGLEEKVRFDGWVEDVNTWFEDKDYIVCTSVLEGHPVGVMEAMACGLKPLIHNYVGARGSYPDQYIWNTIPEFIEMVTDGNYDSLEYRKFIETNYSLEMQLEKVDRIISDGCKEKRGKPQSVRNRIIETD
ncbi:MAG: glycosyltransferase [Candidatus Scalindua sp.]|nr:glycosyltransferase [Candidatus Scalindua sp.]